MPRIISKSLTRVAFGKDETVSLTRGENLVTDAQVATLKTDARFMAKVSQGHFEIVADKPVTSTPAAKPVVSAPAPTPAAKPVVSAGSASAGATKMVGPRARITGEKQAAYEARMAKIDAAKADATEELFAAWDALGDNADGKTALYATLTDAEKVLIDGRVKPTA